MSVINSDMQAIGEVRAAPIDPKGRYLFHPIIDFLCLGGGSLIVLALILLMRSFGWELSAAVAVMFAVAQVINDPHFANSYQIFYRKFPQQMFR